MSEKLFAPEQKNPAQNSNEELVTLANKLHEIDVQIKRISGAVLRFDGTDQVVNKDIPGYVSRTTADDVIDAMTPPETVEELTAKARDIIQQMLVIDPTVHLPTFDEYGY